MNGAEMVEVVQAVCWTVVALAAIGAWAYLFPGDSL